MKTIVKENINTLIIKNSKFISYSYIINNEKEVKEKLENLKTAFFDSTHICYAYRLINKEKYFDDGEPIAAEPILNVLKKENIYNVLVVVIRYFGGIKLGIGGLVKAYTESTKKVVSDLKELGVYKKVKLFFKYEYLKAIDNLLKNEKIINKEFNDIIIYEVFIKDEELLNKLKNIKIEIEKGIYYL
jgi:uncharacterized YigZ family protein